VALASRACLNGSDFEPVIVEMQSGDHTGEDDIVQLKDGWGSGLPGDEFTTDQLLLRLAVPDRREWVRVRLATMVRYRSNAAHRMRMLSFDDPSNDVATLDPRHRTPVLRRDV
jgi:hypothetical protein